MLRGIYEQLSGLYYSAVMWLWEMTGGGTATPPPPQQQEPLIPGETDTMLASSVYTPDHQPTRSDCISIPSQRRGYIPDDLLT